jgi:hypothetical protein
MGHSLSFQALPEGSRLCARLQGDQKLGTLFAQLFNCGGGPYTWASLDDLGDILDGIAEQETVFASREDVDQATAELLADLEEAQALHPGLEARRAFLEKTQWDIEERLARELDRRSRSDAGEFVQALLFGAAPLTPPGVRGPLGDGLRVVRPATVAEAARALGEVTPESLFDEEGEDWLCEDFRSWRGLYLAAAAHGEAVVVGD